MLDGRTSGRSVQSVGSISKSLPSSQLPRKLSRSGGMPAKGGEGERGRGVRVRGREGGQVRRGRLGRPGRLRPRRRPGRRPPRQQRERQKENHDLSLSSPLSLSRSPLLLLPPSRCRCRRWRWQQQRWRQRRHNSAHTHPLSIVNTSPVLDEREGIVALLNEDMCFGPSLVP